MPKKLTKEALRVSHQYHPTSVKFDDKNLLMKLKETADISRVSQREIIEFAVERVLKLYDKHGAAVLSKYMPLTPDPKSIVLEKPE